MKKFFSLKLLLLSFTVIVAIGILITQQTRSAIQTEFNINRKPVGVNLTSNTVFPDDIATFHRQSSSVLTDNPRSGRAIYIHGGEAIELSIIEISDKHVKDVVNGNFLTVSCGDVQGQVETYLQEKIPYRYATCQGLNFWSYEFRWINEHWMLTASTSSTSHALNANNLLEFVNNYPY